MLYRPPFHLRMVPCLPSSCSTCPRSIYPFPTTIYHPLIRSRTIHHPFTVSGYRHGLETSAHTPPFMYPFPRPFCGAEHDALLHLITMHLYHLLITGVHHCIARSKLPSPPTCSIDDNSPLLNDCFLNGAFDRGLRAIQNPRKMHLHHVVVVGTTLANTPLDSHRPHLHVTGLIIPR